MALYYSDVALGYVAVTQNLVLKQYFGCSKVNLAKEPSINSLHSTGYGPSPYATLSLLYLYLLHLHLPHLLRSPGGRSFPPAISTSTSTLKFLNFVLRSFVLNYFEIRPVVIGRSRNSRTSDWTTDVGPELPELPPIYFGAVFERTGYTGSASGIPSHPSTSYLGLI